MHRLHILVILLVTIITCASGASAFELVMFRRVGCPWCAAWDRDVGAIYAKTEVGRLIPVRFADLDRDRETKIRLKSPIRFTPTFVLVDQDREIGRIEGYPGEDFFWGLLERLVPGPASERDDGTAPSGR
jgi:thioredoxin-related protein